MIKQSKAITLIALIITIIVLLILAGVTINMILGDNGLFNKSKTSVGKYENAQEKENIALEGYEDKINGYIDGNRDTVILTTEQYNNLFSNPDNKLKDMPNTWEVGKEYCWGNENSQIYGQRFTGTITNNSSPDATGAGTYTMYTTLSSTLNNKNCYLISCGGNWNRIEHGPTYDQYAINSTYSLIDSTSNRVMLSNQLSLKGDCLRLTTIDNTPSGVSAYDVWILYKKNT